MNVLSLFDGMSCGQQALERAEIKVENYFASEIDKYAIQVTMANYPKTKQLGSVVDVDGYTLPKIDLLLGGSPCQSFSFAGKRKGMATKDEQEILTLEHYLELKSDGFEFEGQSYLFWEYMRILKEVKPKYFLLENVMMGEKWEKILSKAIGVNPIMINSRLVSAQNRKRLYWTNIGMKPMGLFGYMESIIEQPKDKGILLKDILESDVDDKYYLSEKMIKCLDAKKGTTYDTFYPANPCGKSRSINARCFKMGSGDNYINEQPVVHNTMPRSSKTGKGGTGPLSRNDGKTYCLDTGSTNAVEIFDAIKYGRTKEAKEIRKENMKKGIDYSPFSKKEEIGLDFEKMGTLTTSPNKDNLIKQLNPSTESGGKQPYQQNRVYDVNGISPALCAHKADLIVKVKLNSNDKRLNKMVNENIFLETDVIHLDTYNQTMDKNKAAALKLPHNDRFLFAESRIRRLTPVECERLQTVKDHYTAHVSDTQRYKMLGNGWTIEVIKHILSYL